MKEDLKYTAAQVLAECVARRVSLAMVAGPCILGLCREAGFRPPDPFRWATDGKFCLQDAIDYDLDQGRVKVSRNGKMEYKTPVG